MERESFIFYRDWRDGIASLTPSLRVEIYDAVVSFALDGTEPQLSHEAQMIFSFLRPKLLRDTEKYQSRCERNKANGSLGGRPPKTEKTQRNRKNPVGFPKTEKTQTNPVGWDKDKDKDKDSQEPIGSMSEDLTILADGMSDSGAVRRAPSTMREKVMWHFNERMQGRAICRIRSIENKRAELLRARLRQSGEQAVMEVIDKAAASSFLNGNNQKGWTATLNARAAKGSLSEALRSSV